MHANLVRRTTGLTEAHCELIRMLAAIAVEDYLREVEAAPTDDDEADFLQQTARRAT